LATLSPRELELGEMLATRFRENRDFSPEIWIGKTHFGDFFAKKQRKPARDDHQVHVDDWHFGHKLNFQEQNTGGQVLNWILAAAPLY
jgi:hypothetical protein